MRLKDYIKVANKSDTVELLPDDIKCQVKDIPENLYDRKVRKMKVYDPIALDGPGVILQIRLENK